MMISGQFEGHKWNLKALWRYFEEELKMDWRPIWERIKVRVHDPLVEFLVSLTY